MNRFIGIWHQALMALLLTLLSFSAAALSCATPGKDGAGGVLNAPINRYWPATASAGAGTNSIALGTSIGAGNSIAVGDLLLVIQMQDAAIDSTNTSSYGKGTAGDPGSGSTALNSAGLYEFVRATTAVPTTGGTVNLVGGSGGGLLNTYTNAAFGTQGQRRFQVVRVPQYTTATLGTGLTATAWNGSAGGVLVFDVAGALTLGGATVSVNGLGMRGGGARQLGAGAGARTDYRTLSTVNNNGSKGEGIAGTPRWVNNAGTTTAASDTGVEGYPNGSHARGAPGNAGGGGTDGDPAANDENTGGGGGSNAGSGGKGGDSWNGSTPAQTGGWGGFDYSGSVGPARLFLGGGGGSGSTNNATGSPGAGFASSGAAGGGLVMIRAGSITGSATISANGANANNTVTNDASGGGGAGGSVLVFSGGGSVGTLTVQATGGTGGINTGGGSPHGPGGGGSGGYVATSGAAAIAVSGGAAGTTAGGINHGATAGASGASTTSLLTGQIPGVKSGAECAIRVTKSFSPSPMGNGRTATLTVTLVSSNDVAITGIVLNDIFPTTPGAMMVASPLTTTNACGATPLLDSGGTTLAAADVGVRLDAGTLSANGTCTFSVGITANVLGEYTNTIPIGALTSTNGGTNAVAASAVLTVVGPSLVFLKTVAVFSDPSNGTTNPKNIPGAFVDYTLRVTNTGLGTVTLDTVVITDPIPANTDLFIGDLVATPAGPIAFTSSTTTPTSTASGLSFTFTSLDNAADDIGFFSDAACTTLVAGTPTPPNDINTNVRCIRLNPKGTMAGQLSGNNPFIDLRFRVRVR